MDDGSNRTDYYLDYSYDCPIHPIYKVGSSWFRVKSILTVLSTHLSAYKFLPGLKKEHWLMHHGWTRFRKARTDVFMRTVVPTWFSEETEGQFCH